MAVVRLFASAREAAGVTSEHIEGATVGDVLAEASRRYGDRFSTVLGISKIWVNGEPAGASTPVAATDVVAVLPPVSGGSAIPRIPPETRLPEIRPAEIRPADVRPADVRPSATKPLPTGPVADPASRARAPAVRGNLALVAETDPDPQPDGDEPGPELPDTALPKRPPLAVVHHSVRPHGRLGLAWAAVTAAVAAAGPVWLAAWLALAALVAATQTAGLWRRRGERPMPAVAAGIAAAIPIAASFGAGSFNAGAVNGVIVGGVMAGFLARLLSPTRAPSRDVALTLVIGIPIGLAAASPVIMRHDGVIPALFLLSLAAVYDASAYLVGTGATSTWEGPAAGVTALVPLTIFAAVVFIPPFSGSEPLLLGFLAAVLTPIGPVAASALLGDRTADAPGLRRLDSLLVMGPIWTWVALIFLR